MTEILVRAGSKTLLVNDKRISGKRLMARLLWDIVTTGEAQFPDGRILKVSPRDWLETVKFMYAQIDPPARAEIDITSGGQPIAIREVIVELPQPAESSGEPVAG